MINKPILIIFALLGSVKLNAAEATIPAVLAVPEGYVKQLTVRARGDQIFQCVFDHGTYAWKWQAPDAKLYDLSTNKLVGSHTAGPHWHYQDGSGVKAKVIQKLGAPEKTAAQWLLLEAIAHDGKGIFAQTQYIQRINTQGGLAPLTPCDGNHLGSEQRTPYSADYYFYGH